MVSIQIPLAIHYNTFLQYNLSLTISVIPISINNTHFSLFYYEKHNTLKHKLIKVNLLNFIYVYVILWSQHKTRKDYRNETQ